jgi:hypothetical protein
VVAERCQLSYLITDKKKDCVCVSDSAVYIDNDFMQELSS